MKSSENIKKVRQSLLKRILWVLISAIFVFVIIWQFTNFDPANYIFNALFLFFFKIHYGDFNYNNLLPALEN